MRLLSATEAKDLLKEYGIPVLSGGLARSAEEAMLLAENTGFPVVMKVVSTDVVHKSDAGGVLLRLMGPEEVRRGYQQIHASVRQHLPAARIDGISVEPCVKIDREVIVGVSRDEQFGPVVLFGSGGIYTELFDDVALRLLPVDRHEVTAMMAETRAYKLLQGLRGQPPVDIEAVTNVILAISRLVEASGDLVQELDINPLVCSPDGVLAVDARVIVKE